MLRIALRGTLPDFSVVEELGRILGFSVDISTKRGTNVTSFTTCASYGANVWLPPWLLIDYIKFTCTNGRESMSAGWARVPAPWCIRVAPVASLVVLSTQICRPGRFPLAIVIRKLAMSAPFCRNLISRQAFNVAYVLKLRGCEQSLTPSSQSDGEARR